MPSSPPQKLDTTSVWFVTGCSSGIGESLAQTIYNQGHRIVATARDVTSLSYLPNGPTVLKLCVDVTRQDTITQAIANAIDHFHGIDVFVNNAGYAIMGDTEGIAQGDARHQLETNFWGPVHVTREALRVFREVNAPGRGGAVVQISSMGGWITAPGHAFYHASKFALEGFTESVAKEVDPKWNIKFLIVSPGGVRTNFAGPNLKQVPRHPAYDNPNSSFSQLIQYITNPESQATWSDPDLCARVLFDAVVGQHERPLPTRLLMGAETIPLLKEDIQRTLRDIDLWENETIRCSPNGGAVLNAYSRD